MTGFTKGPLALSSDASTACFSVLSPSGAEIASLAADDDVQSAWSKEQLSNAALFTASPDLAVDGAALLAALAKVLPSTPATLKSATSDMQTAVTAANKFRATIARAGANG